MVDCIPLEKAFASAPANNGKLGVFFPNIKSIPFGIDWGVMFLISLYHRFIKWVADKLVTDIKVSF